LCGRCDFDFDNLTGTCVGAERYKWLLAGYAMDFMLSLERVLKKRLLFIQTLGFNAAMVI